MSGFSILIIFIIFFFIGGVPLPDSIDVLFANLPFLYSLVAFTKPTGLPVFLSKVLVSD